MGSGGGDTPSWMLPADYTPTPPSLPGMSRFLPKDAPLAKVHNAAVEQRGAGTAPRPEWVQDADSTPVPSTAATAFARLHARRRWGW